MLTIILLLIFGSAFAYVSKNNLTPVSLHIGPYLFANIPLFYVIIGSLITGILVSYIFYIIHVISASIKLRSKVGELKKNKDEVLELTKRVRQLELENEKLKDSASKELADRNAL